MSNKTYADECLERSEKATSGPWEQIGGGAVSTRITTPDEVITVRNTNKPFEDGQFIASARTDVPELAKRLNRAITALKEAAFLLDNDNLLMLADELDEPLEKK